MFVGLDDCYDLCEILTEGVEIDLLFCGLFFLFLKDVKDSFENIESLMSVDGILGIFYHVL